MWKESIWSRVQKCLSRGEAIWCHRAYKKCRLSFMWLRIWGEETGLFWFSSTEDIEYICICLAFLLSFLRISFTQISFHWFDQPVSRENGISWYHKSKRKVSVTCAIPWHRFPLWCQQAQIQRSYLHGRVYFCDRIGKAVSSCISDGSTNDCQQRTNHE